MGEFYPVTKLLQPSLPRTGRQFQQGGSACITASD